MAATSKIRTGFLVIADISGYTSFKLNRLLTEFAEKDQDSIIE
jgi:hypothetical protein